MHVDDKKPWILAKDKKNKEEVIKIAVQTINLTELLILISKL